MDKQKCCKKVYRHNVIKQCGNIENKITSEIKKQYSKLNIHYVNEKCIFGQGLSWLKENGNKVMHVLKLNLWLRLKGQKRSYSINNAVWHTDKNHFQLVKKL